jgi:hypothetical protein
MRPRSGAAIIIAKTDNDGWYRFRLPPGRTFVYVYGPVPAQFGSAAHGGREVEIPDDEREFIVPTIELQPGPRKG